MSTYKVYIGAKPVMMILLGSISVIFHCKTGEPNHESVNGHHLSSMSSVYTPLSTVMTSSVDTSLIAS